MSENPIIRFLANTDPGRAAGDEHYEARPKSIQEALKVGLRPSSTARVLLVGQTGVGKTTEIDALRLSDFSQDFTVIAPQVDEDLDLGAVDWTGLLVFAAGTAGERFGRNQNVARAVEALRAALRPRQEHVVRTEIPSVTQTGLGLLGQPYLGAKTVREETRVLDGPPEPTVTQRFRNDPVAVRRQIADGVAQFQDLAVGVFRAVEAAGLRPVLVVLDGLEKLPVDQARDLFGQAGTALLRWPCRLLVTGPLGMAAEPWFAEVEERFSAVEHVRAISCLPGEPGVDFFLSLARRRGALDIMDEDDVVGQISWCGGLPRQFLQLLTRAAQDAAAAGLTRVTKEFHQRARYRLAQRFQYQLEPQDWTALDEPAETRTKEQRNRLIRIGALIEYDRPDGSFGADLNPLVGLLKSQRSGKAGA